MKKLFLVLSLVGICIVGYAQDVKVNINNQDGTAIDNCPYRINGICITEDIGGVEVEFQKDDASIQNYIVLTNYNKFAVTVLWSIAYPQSYYHYPDKIGNTILKAEEQKKILLVSTHGEYKYWSLEGLIVRKLAQ